MPQANELLWSTVLIAAIGVGALLIVLVARAFRRRMRSNQNTETFTIQDLRNLRDAGDITQQEYEAMRAAVIGQITGDSPTDDDQGPVPPRAPDAGDSEEPPDADSTPEKS